MNSGDNIGERVTILGDAHGEIPGYTGPRAEISGEDFLAAEREFTTLEASSLERTSEVPLSPTLRTLQSTIEREFLKELKGDKQLVNPESHPGMNTPLPFKWTLDSSIRVIAVANHP